MFILTQAQLSSMNYTLNSLVSTENNSCTSIFFSSQLLLLFVFAQWWEDLRRSASWKWWVPVFSGVVVVIDLFPVQLITSKCPSVFTCSSPPLPPTVCNATKWTDTFKRRSFLIVQEWVLLNYSRTLFWEIKQVFRLILTAFYPMISNLTADQPKKLEHCAKSVTENCCCEPLTLHIMTWLDSAVHNARECAVVTVTNPFRLRCMQLQAEKCLSRN